MFIFLNYIAISMACFMSGNLYCCQCPTGLQCTENAVCELPSLEPVHSDFELLTIQNSYNEPSGIQTFLSTLGILFLVFITIICLYFMLKTKFNNLIDRVVERLNNSFDMAFGSPPPDVVSFEMHQCHLSEVVVA